MNAPFRKEGRRILSLWLPCLGTDRILRQRLGRDWRSGTGQSQPLVLSRQENNSRRIAALDEKAERLGLRRGTGIADARAMYPSLEVVEADPEADRRLIEALADWCDRYTPLVALDGVDGLFLDISGCAHLFGGERCLLDDIAARFFHQGFAVRAGLASTPGAAWAAARFAPGGCILGQGEEESFMAGLPLAALRLEAATRTSLESVGLSTVGSIAGAPRAPLARRFGTTLILRLDQALGRVEEAISPRLPVAVLSVERHLAEPVALMEDIERLVLLLAGSLKQDLERRGEGARSLELLLFRVDGAVGRVAVGASLPLREPHLIGRLFHERLAALEREIDAGYGFDLVRLSALATAAFESTQGDLSGAALSGDRDIAMFADRVRARLGPDALLRPQLSGSHVPERAASLRRIEAVPAEMHAVSDSLAGGSAVERPLRLLTPAEPIEVPATEVPEGPPLNFRWRRALYRVTRAEGPERIAPEWWREQEAAASRDYFRVEDADGRRYWLYREGLYDPFEKIRPRWYLQGLSA
jgi:protein ImuB